MSVKSNLQIILHFANNLENKFQKFMDDINQRVDEIVRTQGWSNSCTSSLSTRTQGMPLFLGENTGMIKQIQLGPLTHDGWSLGGPKHHHDEEYGGIKALRRGWSFWDI